jgi:hypothetical protein
MSDRESFERGPRVFIFRGELGLWWASSEAIGLGGRRSGAVLYAESSGVGVVVGGETVWMGWPRVQFGCVWNRARQGRSDRRGSKAWVARRRVLVADLVV